MIRCDFGCGSTSASTRSATACLAERLERSSRAARLDVLGDLAQRELAQRAELVGAEEVLERDLGLRLRVDLAGPETLRSSSGDRSTSTTSSASSRIRSGKVSRTRTSVSSKIASLRLSRCWTLTVEMTSMPASRTSSMSCQRFSFRIPAAFVCASSSMSASSGARASTASTIHLLELERAVLRAQARHDLEPFGERRSSRDGRAARDSRSRRPAPPPAPAAPRAACGTSCRRPRPSRAGSGSGLAPPHLTLRRRCGRSGRSA